MIFRVSLVCPSLIVLGFLLSACQSTPSGSGTAAGASTSQTGGFATSQSFLATTYAPMAKWLDRAESVSYKHMTPQLIFEQAPLNAIRFDTINLPANATPFNYSSGSISRRDLLAAIARHWNLTMTFITDGTGTPQGIRVNG